MYIRSIHDQIVSNLFKGKIVIIYGARRTGKTTIVQEILKNSHVKSKYFNCDLNHIRSNLETTNPEKLKYFLGDNELIVLDEAQRVKNVGLILKILIDTFPKLQIIATGSSSFDLANKISEPLTGRARRYFLYPLSLTEIRQQYDAFDLDLKLENLIRFGSYPGVFDLNKEDSIDELEEIGGNYLYKDVLEFQSLKKSDLLMDLLQALALQLGNEVSYRELGSLLGQNHITVQKYMNLLEQSFVIFKLRSFSRNLRKELGKSFKVYFYDLGIRNMLINNFNILKLRNDVGALFENFCVIERMKKNQALRRRVNTYFWRTYDQKEIDYIEEVDGKLNGFEFKFNSKKKVKPPKDWLKNYENASFEVINRENYLYFVI